MSKRPAQDHDGVRSPEFARLVAFQIPVGAAFVLIGRFQLQPGVGSNLLTGIGVFLMVYAVILLVVLYFLRRRSS